VAFAAFNTITATYALLSLMGLRNAMVDIWLGFVERLYVSDKKAPVVRVRRRRAEPQTAPPSWQDVLYRGAAATATGDRVAESAGMFRILADAPEPPVLHNRRVTDRMGPAGYGRRAADRVDGAGRRADDHSNGSAQRTGDRSDGNGRRAGDQPRSPAERAGERVEVPAERVREST